METIESVLLAQLAEKFGGEPQLSDSLVLVGVDSVGMAELTLDIEKNFNISVDDRVLSVDTVQDLVDYIREKQVAKATGR